MTILSGSCPVRLTAAAHESWELCFSSDAVRKRGRFMLYQELKNLEAALTCCGMQRRRSIASYNKNELEKWQQLEMHWKWELSQRRLKGLQIRYKLIAHATLHRTEMTSGACGVTTEWKTSERSSSHYCALLSSFHFTSNSQRGFCGLNLLFVTEKFSSLTRNLALPIGRFSHAIMNSDWTFLLPVQTSAASSRLPDEKQQR